jgi:hypothetical protein
VESSAPSLGPLTSGQAPSPSSPRRPTYPNDSLFCYGAESASGTSCRLAVVPNFGRDRLKATCRQAGKRIDLTKMTQLRLERVAFAAMHGPHLLLYLPPDVWPWGKADETARTHHVARRCGRYPTARLARDVAGLLEALTDYWLDDRYDRPRWLARCRARRPPKAVPEHGLNASGAAPEQHVSPYTRLPIQCGLASGNRAAIARLRLALECRGPVAQWLEPTAHNGLMLTMRPPHPRSPHLASFALGLTSRTTFVLRFRPRGE